MKVWTISYYDSEWKDHGTQGVYLHRETAEEEFRRLKNDPAWRYCWFNEPYEHEVNDGIRELLVELDMRMQELAVNLNQFLNLGFDPDAYYTPCENATYRIFEALGYTREDITDEAYTRLTKEND